VDARATFVNGGKKFGVVWNRATQSSLMARDTYSVLLRSWAVDDSDGGDGKQANSGCGQIP
jgi:hypothetical protein